MARLLLTVLIALALVAPARSAPAPRGLGDALSGVRGEAFRAHVEFLADDLLEGREAGTVGYDLAALYVATELRSMGIRPAGDDGTFFQAVRLRESRLLSGEVTFVPEGGGDPVTLTPLDDYVQRGDPLRAEGAVSAPVVFAGFGITAPALDHDDYAGIDVEGAIVLVLTGAPSGFPSEHRAHFASSRLKAANAARHGAVGALYFQTAEDAERVPWDRVRQYSNGRTTSWLQPDGTPSGRVREIEGVALLGHAGARRLFSMATVAFDEVLARATKGESGGFPLPVRATIASETEHRSFTSANVVGVLEGADPGLSRTSVVFSAHLDHVGIRDPVDGDRIYNGAYDNASGAAVVLEVARAFSRLEARPSRSLVFLFVTAEETGLLGSDFFARNPPPTAGRPVANVNVDMALFLSPIAQAVAFGAESSTLGGVVAASAAATGLTIIPDPTPEENSFIRSDQYSFVLQGVPAVALYPAVPTREAETEGGRAIRDFLERHYHRPSDDLSRPMDLESAERFIRAHVLIGHTVASDPEAPRWMPGDFFGETFGRPVRSDAGTGAASSAP